MTSGTQQYVTRTKYDSYYGRPVGQEFPNGEAVQVLYSVYGHAVAEKEPVSGVEYRRTHARNARGQSTQETFGNGVVLTPTYQLQTGQLTGLTYANTGGTLRQLGYGYDVFGNLKRQSLGGGASREDYSYDELHRLVQSIRSGAASGTVNYGFDAVGNLTKKSDFSANTSNAYSYTGATCGGGANAVKSVQLAAGGSRTYCYDANGNLTGDNAGLSLKYDHQNMPIVAQRGALRDDFRYGPDGMRTRSWGSDGARVYLPGYEHRTDTGETKVYIGDYAVISRTGATRKVEYLLKDRLGSVDAVANSSGAVTETRGYDAFGKPRSGTWNDLSPAKIASTAVTPKGFTQHEHLNELELIHMNGRMYDYNVGRFMGVDPFIQFPLNSQSLNPYSYILNNPLSGTDPTGYLIGCGPNYAGCGGGGGGISGDFPNRSTFCKDFCNVALGGGSDGAKNGAKGGSGATSDKRDESKGSASGKLSEIGGAVKRAFLGPIVDYVERGQPGNLGDHLENAAIWGKNTAFDLLSVSPVGQVLERTGNLQRTEYKSEGLLTAGVLQTVSLTGGALKGSTSIAGRVGKTGRVAGEVAEGGAPSMRQPVAARGTQEAVSEVKDVPQQMYGPYYRYGDSPENVNKIIESGELLGNQGRNTFAGTGPAVRAYRDDWQEGLPTIEFTTPVAPYRYSTPSKPVWNSETPGVIVRGDQVAIPCLVTCTRP